MRLRLRCPQSVDLVSLLHLLLFLFKHFALAISCRFECLAALQASTCACVLLFQLWQRKRALAKQRKHELAEIMNSNVFLDGPAGHMSSLCGSM